MKKKHSAARALVILLIAAVIIAGCAVGGGILYYRLKGHGYYAASRAAFDIPGMDEGNVPQGMTYVPESDVFLLTGYIKDHTSPSKIWRVERGTGNCTGSVIPATPDGSPFTAHCGGMAYHDGRVYLTGEDADCLRVYRAEDLLSAQDGQVVPAIAEVSLASGPDRIAAAFTCAAPEGIIVGEFYIREKYETAESHFVETAEGVNHAIAVRFPYDDSETGISETPDLAYSLPDLAQGMVFDGEDVYITQSWGLAMSTVPRYSGLAADGTINAMDRELPLITLSGANLASRVTIAPMAEQPVIVDGLFYVNCESASGLYHFGKLIGAEKMLATDMAFMRGEK